MVGFGACAQGHRLTVGFVESCGLHGSAGLHVHGVWWVTLGMVGSMGYWWVGCMDLVGYLGDGG